MAKLTLVIYNEFEISDKPKQAKNLGLKFYLLRGDYAHLHGKCVNSVFNDEKDDDEMTKLFWNENDITKQITFDKFQKLSKTRDIPVIICGSLP